MNKYFTYAFIIFLLSNINVHAHTVPKFSIVAQTSVPKILMANRILSTQYLVTNNTKITRTLMLSPIKGVIQNSSGPNACPNPFILAPGKSCFLNITLIASQMGAGVATGPVICQANANKAPDPFLCSRPAEKDDLNVKIIPCTSSTCLNSLTEQQIRAVTRSYQQQYAIPGVLAGIWIPGRGDLIITDGVADISTNRPISTADHFHIASITKSFTTTIILQLAQEGRLNLTDPVSQFGIAVQNDTATLGQLADMRSGIFNYSADATFLQEFAANLLRKWLPPELINFANDNDVYFNPGLNWHYSNTNTVLLGMIIEQVTGHFIGNELANRIFKPLGLNQTVYATSPAIPSPVLRGYADQDDVTDIDPSFAGAAGAIVSDFDNLYRWAQALGKGSLLTTTMQQARINSILPMSYNPCFDQEGRPDQSICPEYDAYGYGIGNIGGWIGHTGEYPGYLLLIMYEPSLGATIVIVVNKSNLPGGAHVPTELFRDYLSILNL